MRTQNKVTVTVKENVFCCVVRVDLSEIINHILHRGNSITGSARSMWAGDEVVSLRNSYRQIAICSQGKLFDVWLSLRRRRHHHPCEIATSIHCLLTQQIFRVHKLFTQLRLCVINDTLLGKQSPDASCFLLHETWSICGSSRNRQVKQLNFPTDFRYLIAFQSGLK